MWMDLLQSGSALFYILSTAGYIIHLCFQRDAWQRVGYALFGLGFLCHTLFILMLGIATGLFPGGTLSQAFLLAGWGIAGTFLLIRVRLKLKILGIYAAPLAAVMMILALEAHGKAMADPRFFKSVWVFFHVMAMFLGNGALALACGAGILYLLQEHAIKTRTPGFFFRRLPSLDLLDRVGYSCLVLGFSFLTFGLAAGIIYAKIAWGRFWGWDPKEVWAGIVWLFYAALLHERLTVGWRGRRAAVMAVVGFGVILFTFIGVNFLLQGHHGGFTQW